MKRRMKIKLKVIMAMVLIAMICRNQSSAPSIFGVYPERKEEIEKMKIPLQKDVSENPYIYCYNYELCREKELIKGEELDYHYLYMQAIYRLNLDAYLLETLDIKALNEKLKNSDLGFVCRKPENRNLYERESMMELEFIYLRNNLYIEYLSEDQLKLLENQLKAGKTEVTDEIKKMVKETYREVIRVRNPANWEDQSSFLYPEAKGRKPKIPNRALVLGVSNAMEYDASGNLLPENHMKEKCEYLEKVKAEKEKEYSEILGTQVYILLE